MCHLLDLPIEIRWLIYDTTNLEGLYQLVQTCKELNQDISYYIGNLGYQVQNNNITLVRTLHNKGIYSKTAVVKKCIEIGNNAMFSSMFEYLDNSMPKMLNSIYRENGCSEEVACKIRDMLVPELCCPVYSAVVLYSYYRTEKRTIGLIPWVAGFDSALAIPIIAMIADTIDYKPHHDEYSVCDETDIANAIVSVLIKMIECRVPIVSIDNFISLVQDFKSKVKHMHPLHKRQFYQDIVRHSTVPGTTGVFVGSNNLYTLPENNGKRLELVELLGIRDD